MKKVSQNVNGDGNNMTCVIGMLDKDNKVWMGADSIGSDLYTYDIRKDSKLFKNGEFLIGFTTSFRMGQLLMFADLPKFKKKDTDVFKYMVTKFIPAIRAIFKDNGFTSIDSNTESGGKFLVGVRGRLFSIESDFQVAESTTNVVACGCGETIAIASIKTINELDSEIDSKLSCEYKIKTALKVSSLISSHVKPPFKVLNI